MSTIENIQMVAWKEEQDTKAAWKEPAGECRLLARDGAELARGDYRELIELQRRGRGYRVTAAAMLMWLAVVALAAHIAHAAPTAYDPPAEAAPSRLIQAGAAAADLGGALGVWRLVYPWQAGRWAVTCDAQVAGYAGDLVTDGSFDGAVDWVSCGTRRGRLAAAIGLVKMPYGSAAADPFVAALPADDFYGVGGSASRGLLGATVSAEVGAFEITLYGGSADSTADDGSELRSRGIRGIRAVWYGDHVSVEANAQERSIYSRGTVGPNRTAIYAVFATGQWGRLDVDAGAQRFAFDYDLAGLPPFLAHGTGNRTDAYLRASYQVTDRLAPVALYTVGAEAAALDLLGPIRDTSRSGLEVGLEVTISEHLRVIPHGGKGFGLRAVASF